MRFLADMEIAMRSVVAIRNAGHDVVHLRDEGLQRMEDPDILDKARDERRTVLMFDLDFGELLAAGMHDTPRVVIIRLRDQTPVSVTPKLLDVMHQHGAELNQGSVVTVEESRPVDSK